MAADLKINNLRQRKSLLLAGDHLIALDHGYLRDRLHRINYDRVESILSWRRMPWVRMLLTLLLFGGLGILLIITNDPAGQFFGAIAMLVFVLLEWRYLALRKTTIRITRAGKHSDFTGIISRRKITNFLAILEQDIRRVQSEAEERAMGRLTESDGLLPEEPPPAPQIAEPPGPLSQ